MMKVDHNWKLRNITCPICGDISADRILPSCKISSNNKPEKCFDIWVCACKKCGSIYENPQVSIAESAGYAENHYYNEHNDIEAHVLMQEEIAKSRWQLLSNRFSWAEVSNTLDVGAAGAWSQEIIHHGVEAQNYLIEPSIQAIEICRNRYDGVKTFHGLFESFDFSAKNSPSFDLITFFHSFYFMADPIKALKKAKALLSEGGKILISISNVLMDVEVWSDEGRMPWINMEFVIRGVHLVYYTPEIVKNLIVICGLEIEEEFVFQYPDASVMRSRQDRVLIIRNPKEKGISTSGLSNLKTPNSAAKIRNMCVAASRKSIQRFVETNNPTHITLAYDDLRYAKMVENLFREKLEEVNLVSLEFGWDKISDKMHPETVIINLSAIEIAKKDMPKSLSGIRCINSVNTGHFDVYGYYEMSGNGQYIMTRACLPHRAEGADIFPFDSESNEVIKL